MKRFSLLLILFSLLLATPTYAQKKKSGGTKMFEPKKSRSDYFGSKKAPKRIMKNKSDKVRPFGFQAQLGIPTTLVHINPKNEKRMLPGPTDAPVPYEINPITRVGIAAEFGFVHMNMRAAAARSRIIDYFDYGIGYKMWRGAEEISMLYDGSKTSNKNEFTYHDLYARFGLHKLQYLTLKKNLFIDHSLGINFDYRLSENIIDRSTPPAVFPQKFEKNMHLMVHYDVGLGIRLAKGRYLVIGVQAPLMEFLNKPIANPVFNSFSSKYYPFLIRIKYFHLFPAKNNQACWTGDSEQRKLNEQFLQGQ